MIPLRPTTSTENRLLPVTLAAVVAAIVLGILGMHALNTHDVMSSPMAGPMAGNASGEDPPAPVRHVAGETAGDRSGDVAGGPVSSDHAMGDMVMLCVFMLAAAGALLLAHTALRRTPHSYMALRPSTKMYVRLPHLRADTGPPPVWEFSVNRC